MRAKLRQLIQDRQLQSIAARPRHQSGSAAIGHDHFEYVDALSFSVSYQEIFLNRAYHFLSDHPAPRILDCGANIGLAGCYWKRVYPGARITAFEPDPLIAAVLRRNLAAWGGADVEVVEAAVSDRAGAAHFVSDHADGGRLAEEDSGDGGLRVSTVDLRSWLDEPVDMLKMDIEGAETDLLNTCRDRLGSVANLIVEYHDPAHGPQRLDEVLAVLRHAGFRYHTFSKAHPVKPLATPYGPSGTPQYIDIFATRHTGP